MPKKSTVKVIKRSPLPWPDTVYVLDPKLFTIDDTRPGCDDSNWPYSFSGSMQAEIRQKLPNHHHANLMIDIWLGIFAKLCHVKVLDKGSTKYTRIDAYNATWAALGYIDNQCPRALDLLHKAIERFGHRYPYAI